MPFIITGASSDLLDEALGEASWKEPLGAMHDRGMADVDYEAWLPRVHTGSLRASMRVIRDHQEVRVDLGPALWEGLSSILGLPLSSVQSSQSSGSPSSSVEVDEAPPRVNLLGRLLNCSILGEGDKAGSGIMPDASHWTAMGMVRGTGITAWAY